MTKQLYNSEAVNLLATHFPKRNEPSYAWGNAISGMQLVTRLRGLWSGVMNETYDLIDLSGQGRVMHYQGSMLYPSVYGVTPYCNFVRTSSNYYRRLTEPGVEITTYLTSWIWVRFHTECTGNAVGIFSKWGAAGQRSWMISKDANDKINFDISDDGTNINNVTDDGDNYGIDEWIFIGASYSAGSDQYLYVGKSSDGILHTYSDSTGIYAALHNSTAALEVGRGAAGNYFDGYLSLWGLAMHGVYYPEMFNIFHQTRPLFLW